MCTMISRMDFFRLFGGLLRISARQTNAEPRCLTLLDSHDGAICAAKHLELVHAHHLANPYTDLTNSIWGTKYGLTAEYPSTNLHKNSVYCILTRSSKNAAKFKQ